MRASRLAFALLVAVTTAASAAEYYVSTTGNDSDNGSFGSPFLTMAKGLSVAQDGDTVFVRGGTYTQRITFPRSGSVSAPITLRAYPGETPVIDLTNATPVADQADQPVITVTNVSNIVVQGFTIQNWRSSNPNALPEGILVAAKSGNNQCNNVRILGNNIHHIEQNDTTLNNFDANAHGIKIAGRSNNTMTGIVIDGNEVHHLRLGASEALVVNGNVSGWRITNNRVHDNNNIGIDMIGYENGNLPASLDRARNGVCAGNVVYNIDARFNPSYGGNFSTGGGDPSADGIYVDGATNVIIERNIVYSCNYGIEIASEESLANNGKADFITLRNNIIHRNHQAGLIMGGYNANRGTTENCIIVNNTFYLNNVFDNAETITFQHHVNANTFRNNIVVANSSRTILASTGSTATSTFTNNVFSHNLYYSASGSPLFVISGSRTLASWQSATSLSGGDAGSTAENPLFEDPTPPITAVARSYKPVGTSPAINTGQPSPAYQTGSGELDFDEHSRLRSGRVDRGAFER